MYTQLYDTYRCHLFEEIASQTWDRIVTAHGVGNNPMETGITSDILTEILSYSKRSYPNFDVFAKKGWNEDEYGSDMDVFVETYKGEYRWFALQAKILQPNATYTTLRDTSDGIMQWDKLALLEGLTGCKAYHLLYNGLAGLTHTANDQCGNPFDEKQFGCSLVEIKHIKTFATKTGSTGRFINPTFADIHPQYAQPWRILTCCRHRINGELLYTRDQVLRSNPRFKRIMDKQELEFLATDLEVKEPLEITDERRAILESAQGETGNDVGNKIAIASQEAKWNPVIRLLINRTS